MQDLNVLKLEPYVKPLKRRKIIPSIMGLEFVGLDTFAIAGPVGTVYKMKYEQDKLEAEIMKALVVDF